MFCLASSHSETTKYDLHSHFTDETTAHEENRHRRWRFEGSPRLENRHAGFAPRTVSPRYYLASQGYSYPSAAYAEIPQVTMSLFLKSRRTGKSVYTTPTMTQEYSPAVIGLA